MRVFRVKVKRKFRIHCIELGLEMKTKKEMSDIIQIYRLKNKIQTYAWGSTSAIPLLQGRTPRPDMPEAELWMGAHPKAPSLIKVDANWVPLNEIIKSYPTEFIGKKAAEIFDGKLPYLFKILAADQPLSLQAHPDLNQAQLGFERENNIGIPFEAPHRNYKDDNHKPECICALTAFWAMCGFRKVTDILTLASPIVSVELDRLLQILKESPDSEGLKRFFYELMTQSSEVSKQITRDAVTGAKTMAEKDPVYRWLLSLADAYPDDIGVLAPLYLNLIKLQPGEALYLSAGELHAYLKGVGIELMANSDNVLRGGLTPKYVDVTELLRVLNFKERELQVLKPQASPNGESIYPCDVSEFKLSTLTVDQETIYRSDVQRSIEIILCTSGKSTITDSEQNNNVALDQGASVVVPAAVKGYVITGEAVLYKASVPL